MPHFRTWIAPACGLLCLSAISHSAEPLPRFDALEPEAALEAFETAPGFRLELVAAEPLVHDPIAMAFDENLTLYVVEMRGYSERRDDKLGTIRALKDTDGDGTYDHSEVLVDELPWPTALACWKGGVFVAAPPDLWYFKDTDGDGKADQRDRLLTGFSHHNVQAMVNSFRWGLDNRIHAATSSGGMDLAPVTGPGETVSLRLRDFAFDPASMDFSPTTEGGQHGMGFDDWGRKFCCSNSDHLKQVVYEERYLARNPFFSAPDSRLSIAAEGSQPEVYRISPVEPWREMRTRLRLEGKLMQFRLEGGGRAAGYFTAATGITIYRGDAWPEEFRGMAIVGDVGSNLVHRNRLDSEGIPFSGHRVDEKSEFIRSPDTWFRPVQFANGPDGNLYVADMYREIIEHPSSFGDVIKPLLDLNSGWDRGRIYRVVHEQGKETHPTPLGKLSSDELAEFLGHPNAWHRETAARLIYERQEKATASAIRAAAKTSSTPFGRLHALYALAGLGELKPDDLIVATSDSHPGVRTHAVRLSEPFLNDNATLQKRVADLATDPDLAVRFQVAFSLGEIKGEARLEPLSSLAKKDAADSWIRMAILTSLNNGADQVFSKLLADQNFRRSDGSPDLLRDLARLIARKNDTAEMDRLLSALAELPKESEQGLDLSIVLGLREGARTGSANFQRLLSPEETTPGALRFRKVLSGALKIATDSTKAETARLDAIQLSGLLPLAESREPLSALLGGEESDTIQKEVVTVLGRYSEEEITHTILEWFGRLTPAIRTAAMNALFARPDRHPKILDAVEEGLLNPGDLDAIQIQRLCLSKDETQAARAVRLLSPNRENDRSKVIRSFKPALELAGDIDRGREKFRIACAICHRAEDFGNIVGPIPATFQNRGSEWMLVNILDPNREVNPEFAAYTITKKDGSATAGLISSESPTSLTLTRADGQTESILRSDIEELNASRLSLMPEGLEAAFDHQGMADLLSYLGSLK